MLEKNQRFKSLLYVLADAALLFIGFLLANYIRFNYVRYFEPGGAGPALAVARDPRNIIAGLATSLVLVLIYWVAGIYSTTRLRGLAERCTKIAVINAAGLLIFIGALYLMHLDDYSRIVLALFYILGTAGVVIERMILRWVDRARRRNGLGLRHILLVGGGKSAALYLRALEHNPYYGFVVDGYLAGIEEPGLGVRYMGSYDALSARLDEIAVDEVVVALEADEIELLPHVFAACDKNGVRITMVPFYSDYLPARPTIDVLDECKLINVRQTPFDNLLNAAVKRGLDIIGSLILIILTSPVMLVTAIGVKLSSPGPVIFRQERIGLNKKPFMMYKFRSMRVNVQQETGWSTDCDPRKTHFGSFIRKFSLDKCAQYTEPCARLAGQVAHKAHKRAGGDHQQTVGHAVHADERCAAVTGDRVVEPLHTVQEPDGECPLYEYRPGGAEQRRGRARVLFARAESYPCASSDIRSGKIPREQWPEVLPPEVLWRKKSPYPKTHNPSYLRAVSEMLRKVLDAPDAPVLQIVRREMLEQLLDSEESVQWYGQLMTRPQIMAYFVQMDYWMRKYQVKVVF